METQNRSSHLLANREPEGAQYQAIVRIVKHQKGSVHFSANHKLLK